VRKKTSLPDSEASRKADSSLRWDIGPSGHADAAEDLAEHRREALAAELILLGEIVEMNVRVAGTRDRWPIVVLWMRRARDMADEAKGEGG
jgi:hypothetical protein